MPGPLFLYGPITDEKDFFKIFWVVWKICWSFFPWVFIRHATQQQRKFTNVRRLEIAGHNYSLKKIQWRWNELMLESRFLPVFSCQNIDKHLFCYKRLVIFLQPAIIDKHFFDHKTLVILSTKIDRRFLHIRNSFSVHKDLLFFQLLL